jgi:Protein of unknown function (DUF4235)
MKRLNERVQWKIVGGLSAALATVATRRLLTAVWHAAGWQPEEAEWGTWGQALAWGVAVGAGMGAARVVAQRAAAAGFQRVTGASPPVEATT